MPQDKKMLNQLLLAKKMSDQENYVAKYNLMNKLLKDHPDEFYVDQDHPDYPGIVHAPTGFRMHLPRQATYGIEKKANYEFIHRSQNEYPEIKALTYDELKTDRAKGLWKDDKKAVEQYIKDRKKWENKIRQILKNHGHESAEDKSFIYATLKDHENMDDWGYTHHLDLPEEILNKSIFDVVGMKTSRPRIGAEGLEKAIKRWKKNKNKLTESVYNGMIIQPRVEVMIPENVNVRQVTKPRTHEERAENLWQHITQDPDMRMADLEGKMQDLSKSKKPKEAADVWLSAHWLQQANPEFTDIVEKSKAKALSLGGKDAVEERLAVLEKRLADTGSLWGNAAKSTSYGIEKKSFSPDLTAEEMQEAVDSIYDHKAPRLAINFGIEKKAFIKEAVGNRAARRIWEIVGKNPERLEKLLGKDVRYFSVGGNQYLDLLNLFGNGKYYAPENINKSNFLTYLEQERVGRKIQQLSRHAHSNPGTAYRDIAARRKIEPRDGNKHLGKHDRFLLETNSPQIRGYKGSVKNQAVMSHLAEKPLDIKVEKLRKSKELPVNELPFDPGRFVYKGGKPGETTLTKDIFFSGHPQVSAGYGSYLYRVKPHQLEKGLPTVRGGIQSVDPSKNFFSTHAAALDPDRRINRILKSRVSGFTNPEEIKYVSKYTGGANSQWADSPFYELVADLKKPINPSLKILGDKAVPMRLVSIRGDKLKDLELGGSAFPHIGNAMGRGNDATEDLLDILPKL